MGRKRIIKEKIVRGGKFKVVDPNGFTHPEKFSTLKDAQAFAEGMAGKVISIK